MARIWIFVWSPLARRFYPQTHQPDRPAELGKGRFRAAAFFGGASGERYDVAAVVATARASRTISRTLSRWRATGNYAGWTPRQVPAGIDEKHCVTVTLR
jgi:hypothetical protein